MPSSMGADQELLRELFRYRGNMRGVENALEAGASVDGRRELCYPPLMVAASNADGKTVKVFIESGADLEAGTGCELHSSDGRLMWNSGSRAVHSAVYNDKLDNLRVLLKAGANHDATDSVGWTPLMAVFLAKDRPGAFAMVKELLKAGADPGLAAHDGKVALHFPAGRGVTHDVLSMLASPATLNHCENDGATPLYYAACEGHEGTVSWLLAAGARDKVVRFLELKNNEDASSLVAAVHSGQGRVVRTMLNEGKEAVRGKHVILAAIVRAVARRKVRLLQMLLADEGGVEAVYGHTASHCIGRLLSCDGHVDLDKKAAIRRILQQAPACRARSWAWPADGAGHGISGATAAMKAPLGVSLVRPMNEAFFTGRLARYCAKK